MMNLINRLFGKRSRHNPSDRTMAGDPKGSGHDEPDQSAIQKRDPGRPIWKEHGARPEFISLVNSVVDVFLDHPGSDQEAMLSMLESRGIPPEQAWQLYQFIPMAFAHAVFGPLGVQFERNYISWAPGKADRVRRPLAEEQLYLAGIEVARQLVGTGTGRDLLPVFCHSAEYNVINHFRPEGGDFHGIACGEPILVDYTQPDA